MITTLILGLAALQAPTGEAFQQLEPRVCSAEPNFVTKERLPVQGEAFRFTGTMRADSMQPVDFTPFASLALLEMDRPEELSAVMSVQPATRERYDVTLRRHIDNELRERSVVGRIPTAGEVPFEIVVTPGREALFRLGNIEQRVPLKDLRPDAIVLGCSSGNFRFDNLVFDGRRS